MLCRSVQPDNDKNPVDPSELPHVVGQQTPIVVNYSAWAKPPAK
jgi:hypothetical protein